MRVMRKAIAMIELIFAIVIMGIVLMSAPLLISTASQSGYVALQQEGIHEAASQANIILSHAWDENDANESQPGSILQVVAGNVDLNESGTTGRRVGTPLESHRTFLDPSATRRNASTIGPDVGDTAEDDIDDFDNTTITLTEVEAVAVSTDDYVDKTVQIQRTVRYTRDTPVISDGGYNSPGGDNDISFNFNTASTAVNAASSTNIKRIEVVLTSGSDAEELQKTLRLHAFSCNIGSFELEER